MPDSLRRLGARVFAGCSRLAYVRYLGDAPVVDPSAYADAPILLMSQVIYGTRGWDGVATSMALPARWPSSNPHILLRWAPERPKVKFCGNGGIPDAVVLEQVTGLGYVLPADDPEHPHGNFSGWWSEPVGGMPIAEATCVTQTYDHAVCAHWDFEMQTIEVAGPFSSGVTNVVEGDTVTLSTPQSVRDGWTNYVCIGWIGTGDVPATGTSSQVTVEISQTSSLAWLYETNYWVCARCLCYKL